MGEIIALHLFGGGWSDVFNSYSGVAWLAAFVAGARSSVSKLERDDRVSAYF